MSKKTYSKISNKMYDEVIRNGLLFVDRFHFNFMAKA